MDAIVYNMTGKESGKVTLPESIFALPWNADLVHQVVTGIAANARTRTAHTKDRSEVRGGGKKPWKQKGTGRARHGSIRSPIWVGGGVAHGPRNERSYKVDLPKKMRTKALMILLAKKHKDGEVLFVDKLSFVEAKTAVAKDTLVSLASVDGFTTLKTKRKNAALILVDKGNLLAKKSFGNLGQVMVEETRNLNALDLVTYKYIIMENPGENLTMLAAKVTK